MLILSLFVLALAVSQIISGVNLRRLRTLTVGTEGRLRALEDECANRAHEPRLLVSGDVPESAFHFNGIQCDPVDAGAERDREVKEAAQTLQNIFPYAGGADQ